MAELTKKHEELTAYSSALQEQLQFVQQEYKNLQTHASYNHECNFPHQTCNNSPRNVAAVHPEVPPPRLRHSSLQTAEQ